VNGRPRQDRVVTRLERRYIPWIDYFDT